MKLTVRMVDDGVSALMLCDDTGKALPEQQSLTIEQVAGDLALLTVKFLVAPGLGVALSSEPGHL